MSRITNLHILTRRLIILTAAGLLTFAGAFALTVFFEFRLMISWVVFLCGIIGGFVSIQQRIKRISDEELQLLAGSWYQIALIPIFGAVFSLVLYCIFLSGLLDSDIFRHSGFLNRQTTEPTRISSGRSCRKLTLPRGRTLQSCCSGLSWLGLQSVSYRRSSPTSPRAVAVRVAARRQEIRVVRTPVERVISIWAR